MDRSAPLSKRPVLRVEHVEKSFGGQGKPAVVAVDDVSFSLEDGECLGIVGESGSGKSTLANLVLRFLDVSGGRIEFLGKDITHAKGKELRGVYRNMQAVFQNPAQSFDPRRTLGDSVCEGMRNHGATRRDSGARAVALFERCGLAEGLLDRYPHEVSGGQCQRAAIARALMVEPKLLVCDEATSALDMTVQEQVVELLCRLQRANGMALVFISHDIALVSQICDRVLVMEGGRVIERGATGELLSHPRQDCTRALIDAVL